MSSLKSREKLYLFFARLCDLDFGIWNFSCYTPTASLVVQYFMFKVSTKGDYGLLLLAELAQAQIKGKRFVPLQEIADSKKLSMRYLSQIITPLKRAGLVKSREGKFGGYCLSQKPSEITVMEILEVLEGPLSPVRCCDIRIKRMRGKCGSENFCQIKGLWMQAKFMLAKFLHEKTLKDLLKPKA